MSTDKIANVDQAIAYLRKIAQDIEKCAVDPQGHVHHERRRWSDQLQTVLASLTPSQDGDPVGWDVFNSNHELIAGRVSEEDAKEIASRFDNRGSYICPLYYSNSRSDLEPIPEGFTPIEEYIAELRKDPEKAEALDKAKERLNVYRAKLTICEPDPLDSERLEFLANNEDKLLRRSVDGWWVADVSDGLRIAGDGRTFRAAIDDAMKGNNNA